MSIIHPTIELIQTLPALESALEKIQPHSVLYFDLEADNINHYYSSISLIQIFIPHHCFCFDMYSELPWEKLFACLEGKEFIVHGADFDLRCLYEHFQFKPQKIFDTMLAARLTGATEFGLSALVKKYIGLDLEKKFQKADWSLRPLPLEMIRYAATDTFYLPEIQSTLKGELTEQGRLSWHDEWCLHEIEAACQTKKEISENAWRVKGSNTLNARQLSYLKALWEWRENLGKEMNRATFRIVSSADLIELSVYAAQNPPESFGALKNLPIKINSKWKKGISEVLHSTYTLPKSEWPSKRILKKPEELLISSQQLEKMKEGRDLLSEKLGLPPSLLASKDAMHQVGRLSKHTEEILKNQTTLMHWQVDVLWPVWKKILCK